MGRALSLGGRDVTQTGHVGKAARRASEGGAASEASPETETPLQGLHSGREALLGCVPRKGVGRQGQSPNQDDALLAT